MYAGWLGSGNIGALLGVHPVLRKGPGRGLGGEGVDKRQLHNIYLLGEEMCIFVKEIRGPPPPGWQNQCTLSSGGGQGG